MFERLADQDFAYLTTFGRRTGKAHTVEIWFGLDDRRVYMLSGGGERSCEHPESRHDEGQAGDPPHEVAARHRLLDQHRTARMATQARFITPATNNSAMRAQQQPRQ